MEKEPQPSAWERTTTRRFLRWLFRPRTIRRALIGLAWAVTVIALCYGIVNWRGRSAWNSYRQNYESHVASLDFQTYIPKAVADEENFAATPFVRSFFVNDTNFLFDHDDFASADKMLVSNAPKNSPNWRVRHFLDLAAWGEAFSALGNNSIKPQGRFQSGKFDAGSRAKAAPAVLDGLKADEGVLNELRAASKRPEARYPVVYNLEDPWAILLPHLSRVKQACLRLQLQACAELAAGQSDKAFDDVKLILYMANSLKTEPFVISYLVRLACTQIAIQPVWEGLAEHRWSDGQLEQLQTELQQYNFLADLETPTHAERAGGVLTVDLFKKNGVDFLLRLGYKTDTRESTISYLLLDSTAVLKEVLNRTIPSGWYDQEKLQYCLLFDHQLAGTVNVAAKRVYPRQIALHASELTDFSEVAGSDATNQTAWAAIVHHRFIAGVLLAGMTKLPSKAAMAQTATDEAAIACALERNRLANGQLAENLAGLVPRWMAHVPKDMMSGEAYKYRRTADGRFILYSVGWDEKDDGGTPGKTLFDTTEGDWVWEPSLGQ
jgi:hypothetical protein